MEENFRRLSQCLNQASQVVQELAANSGRNVAAVVNETQQLHIPINSIIGKHEKIPYKTFQPI